eukprot:2060973-Pleurochrysis_carterae.AAC.1
MVSCTLGTLIDQAAHPWFLYCSFFTACVFFIHSRLRTTLTPRSRDRGTATAYGRRPCGLPSPIASPPRPRLAGYSRLLLPVSTGGTSVL